MQKVKYLKQISRITQIPCRSIFGGSRGSDKLKLYEHLEVQPGASQAEIKKSFFKLAKMYHPDVNKTPEAKKRYLEITEAYETLSNEQKRKVYDATGLNSQDQQNADFNFDGFAGNFSSMFYSAFTDAEDI